MLWHCSAAIDAATSSLVLGSESSPINIFCNQLGMLQFIDFANVSVRLQFVIGKINKIITTIKIITPPNNKNNHNSNKKQ